MVESLQPQALPKVRVIELGELYSAPYCARLLAGFGAEVIKIEEPPVGDPARRLGPFPRHVPDPERSGVFLYLNMNKLGITLNLRTRRGAEIFRELIRDADILIENNPPSKLHELGVGYEDLKKINERLIMTSITPFGQTGPYSKYKAYELNVIHAGGHGYIQRERTPGEEPGPPMKPGARLAAHFGAVNGLIATLCAAIAREGTGVGQHIDVSEQECLASILYDSFPKYQYEGHIMGRGPEAGALAPSGVLPCKDGEVLIMPVSRRQWDTLTEMMGNPDWARTDWARDETERLKNFDIVNAYVIEWLRDKCQDEIVTELLERGICAAPGRVSMRELLDNEHMAQRGYLVEVEHPRAGKVRYPSSPYRFSETQPRFDRPAPLLGQHNEEIYCGRLGLRKEELPKLRWWGVI